MKNNQRSYTTRKNRKQRSHSKQTYLEETDERNETPPNSAKKIVLNEIFSSTSLPTSMQYKVLCFCSDHSPAAQIFTAKQQKQQQAKAKVGRTREASQREQPVKLCVCNSIEFQILAISLSQVKQ